MSEVICHCVGTTKEEIVEAVKAGADTVEKVTDATQAGSGCGGCIDQIEAIINETK